ncbi:hypothetical protein RHABOEDO_000940 [Candidatus Rhabdochlamydia oedothoracis]|uniref:Uncharacterized protein n=1 Tax=Candidatus Rhabdochlamydia oedothoracis TaxID=2720720 RepID=A0ABX8V0S3_9BACT|nr:MULTISPECIES: hypothetical protein [Rhabdochlamydia]KAG6558900.1 hypothetical protein RHOW815_001100 [Candidatus Rhabdochlamydia sp. W815]MCL6756283.1 hypothetical protein [Candidatus Rhabdochlamydia oedothoracis]QYF48731.1 hypothetical protein RHABOEDO_000940 [Candidatus Rhabdochlamydia oedothoracis]
MIKEDVYQYYNNLREKVPFNVINEQNKNVLTQTVKELTESYIFSIGAQTISGSLALKACGISLGTSFPILLALVVAKSFISTLNYAKTAIKTTLNNAKTIVQITAQKAASPFMQVADVINAIFKRVCASFTSFAMSSYHLMRNSIYSFSFRKFDCPLPVAPRVIESKEPIVEIQEKTIEEKSNIAEDLAPSKPELPYCDSRFIIQEGFFLRGIPASLFNKLENFLLENNRELELQSLKSAKQNLLKDPTKLQNFTNTLANLFLKKTPEFQLLKNALASLLSENTTELQYLENTPKNVHGTPMLLILKENSTPWIFFLEHDQSPLSTKKFISEHLKDNRIALSNLSEKYFLKGIPVNYRLKAQL